MPGLFPLCVVKEVIETIMDKNEKCICDLRKTGIYLDRRLDKDEDWHYHTEKGYNSVCMFVGQVKGRMVITGCVQDRANHLYVSGEYFPKYCPECGKKL